MTAKEIEDLKVVRRALEKDVRKYRRRVWFWGALNWVLNTAIIFLVLLFIYLKTVR